MFASLRLASPTLLVLALVFANASHAASPLRALNPQPRLAYEFRIQLGQTGGSMPAAPFAMVEATAQFDASNAAQCGKSSGLSGAVPGMSSHETVRLTRVSPTEYVGTVYADTIVDQDYYGRGVCHWKLTEARVALRASDAPAASRFVAALPADQILAGGSLLRYFWQGYYPSFEQRSATDFGRSDLKTVPAHQQDQFFTVTLTAKKITPQK